MMRRVQIALAFLLVLAASAPAAAQKAYFEIPRREYFVGVPIEISLVAEQFEEDPRPKVKVATPAGAALTQFGYAPNVSTSVSVINGRMTQTRSVRLIFRYRFTASEPGTYKIGPFEVEQDGTTARTGVAEIELREVPISDEVMIHLELPQRAIYPGERVPARIHWAIAWRMRKNIANYTVSVPLFQLTDAFQFVDEELGQDDSRLEVVTPSGPVNLKASRAQRKIRDRDFIIFSAERTLVPLRAGEYAMEPARAVVKEVTSWRRGILGSRKPGSTRTVRADGRPIRLVVKPVPMAGRPPSFAGAVGVGFSLDVSADRSVVQAGDPITLTLVLRGGGNLEAAGLPNLANAGLSEREFRLPSGESAGKIDAANKTFRVQVRVVDSAVREIPALSYSFFDPQTGAFETVVSRPIALSVREANTITAEDVVGGSELPADTPSDEEASSAAQVSLHFTGADLAIVTDHARLLRARNQVGLPPVAQTALYLGSFVLVGLAFVGRRRRDADPELVRRARVLRESLQAIRSASGGARSTATATIAESLRAMRRASNGVPSAELEAFLAECEAVIYAPDGGGDAALDDSFHTRALELARELAEAAK
ncbi:MAG: protein BatD [bacterium]|nr:protein BatD [bacterium]